MYIGWASNVNKDIIDSTSITVGEGATVEDSLEAGGQKKKRLVSASPADRYAVTMRFDFVEKGSDGLTELERFYTWYKYRHCYGVNPFLFPAILINSNRQYGESQETVEHIIQRIANGDPTARLPDNEYYIITSAVEGSKSGTDLELNMTWETYATKPFTIPDDISEIDHIEAENGYIDVSLTFPPTEEPTPITWNVMISKDGGEAVPLIIDYCTYDGNINARLYFTPKTDSGTYTVSIDEFSSSFTVQEI